MKFQLTRPRGTRQDAKEQLFDSMKFQLTRPRGTRHRGPGDTQRQECFNSRVRGGRDNQQGAHAHHNNYVSTHASAGDATIDIELADKFGSVSTHASAGDATMGTYYEEARHGVSTHASAGDATKATHIFHLLKVVSTHASAGDATMGTYYEEARHGVSTHASAGDATKATHIFHLLKVVSTHASAGDATRPRQTTRVGRAWFQLTRPRGTRPLTVNTLSS